MQRFLFLLALVFCLSLTQIFGQSIDSTLMAGMSLRNIGPAGMSGRITAIDALQSDPNNIYIGAASGGVWHSTNRGISWQPIFENEATSSIGSIKINQSNPDEIWVGTGEGNPRNSHNSGKGIYKSIDGGHTWKCMGLQDTRVIHRIHIDPRNSDIVYAGALGTAWGESLDRGLYKTTDGGESWKQILYVNANTGVADMVVDPNNPNNLFVAMWEHKRTPYDFKSGGGGSGIHQSRDGGKTWKKLGKECGLPIDTLGRVGLAIATNKPDIMYALVETKNNQTLYRSDDGGFKWQKQSDKNVGNRPFYYSEIYVDPSNENRIFNLWSYVSMSEDGGKTFKTIMDYGNNVHPDHHAFWISKDNPNFMLNGNDGGLNVSEDGGSNWRFITNIPVGQFYHINVDNDFPYNIYGGMQDNGSWAGPAFVLKRGGIRNADWQELYFGDGFDVAPNPSNNRYGYAMSQGGEIGYWDRETGRVNYIKPVRPDSTALRFSWNAALAIDPFNQNGLYFGSQYVHHSADNGETWTTLSPDLTTNNKAKQDLSTVTGGLTPDVTGAEIYTTLLAISPSTLDSSIIWTGSDDGRLHVTDNGGQSWKSLEKQLPNCPKNAWIPQIHTSIHNASEAFVVVNNYRQNDWKPYLYHTADLGKTWKSIASPETMQSFVCSIVQDWLEPNLLFAGLDDGLYVSFNKGNKWTKYTAFPSVQIRDMVLQHQMDDLVIGTFGRAIWVLDDLEPLRQIAKNIKLADTKLYAFTPETAYQTTTRSYDGIRFDAQGEFQGKNKGTRGRIQYWLHVDKTKVDSLEKKDAYVKIFNADGDTLRTLKHKPKQGLNTVSWNLDQKGVDFPSWEERKADAKENGGFAVEPGQYKVGIYADGDSTYTTILVEPDPRVEQEEGVYAEALAANTAFEQEVEVADSLFNKLGEYSKELEFIKKYIALQVDTVQKSMNKEVESIAKAIDSLQLLFMLPKDTKGYQSSAGKLSKDMWPTSSYVNPAWRLPGSNALRQLTLFSNKVEEISAAITNFESTTYQPFREKVKALEVKLFKDE